MRRANLLKKITLLSILVLLVGYLNRPAYCQSKTGTAIGQFLKIEPSARIAGMGNAGTALNDELMAAYYNPAALGGLTSDIEVQFTHSLWLAELSYNYAAAALVKGANRFKFSLTSLSSDEIRVRTVRQPHGTGERYTVQDIALGLTYARQITQSFNAGLELTYLQERIWHSTMDAFMMNFGMQYRIGKKGPYIGGSVSNFGVQAQMEGRDFRIRFDPDPDLHGTNNALPAELYTEQYPLPVMFRAGISYPWEISERQELMVTINAYHPSDNTESISFGGEWTFMDILSLRGGYQNLFLEDSIVGLTLGSGIQVDVQGFALHFDYAWADYGRLQNTQRFTLRLEL